MKTYVKINFFVKGFLSSKSSVRALTTILVLSLSFMILFDRIIKIMKKDIKKTAKNEQNPMKKFVKFKSKLCKVAPIVSTKWIVISPLNRVCFENRRASRGRYTFPWVLHALRIY